MKQSVADWALIATAYQENRCSIRALAREFNVSEAAIRKKAKKWSLVRGSRDQFALAAGATRALVRGLVEMGVPNETIADVFVDQASALLAAATDDASSAQQVLMDPSLTQKSKRSGDGHQAQCDVAVNDVALTPDHVGLPNEHQAEAGAKQRQSDVTQGKESLAHLLGGTGTHRTPAFHRKTDDADELIKYCSTGAVE